MKRLVLLLPLLAVLGISSGSLAAETPDCTSPGAWPASVAFVKMKNARLINNLDVVFEKTTVQRLVSEKIGADLYRQVHDVTYFKKNGSTVRAMVVSDVSSEECSMSAPVVYLVTEILK